MNASAGEGKLTGRPFEAPPSIQSNMMQRRKRKAADEDDYFDSDRHGTPDLTGTGAADDRMSASPSNSPAMSVRPTPRPTASARNKRVKSNIAGRPLAVPRLLEMLDATALRSMIRSMSERHPELNSEIMGLARPPTVDAAFDVLGRYESALREAFPYGGNTGSDYAYNRVRQPLIELLDALGDFTPHFLPPNESQMTVSLGFLDRATNMVHRLPTWTNSTHSHHKNLAYEEISKAWALVIREAAKKGAGIQLQYGGWDQTLTKHNEQSLGKMHAAINELSQSLAWMGGGNTGGGGGGGGGGAGDIASIRQQLQAGTFGAHTPVRIGPW